MKAQGSEPQPIGNSLNWFIGSLSAEEAAEFENATGSTRQIDPDFLSRIFVVRSH